MATRVVSAEFTRPNDTTAYTAGDAVSTLAGAAMTFSGASSLAGTRGFIKLIKLIKSGSVTTSASFRLSLFTADPVATADNSPLANAWSQRTSFIGSFTLSTMTAEGGVATVSTWQQQTIPIPFDLAAGSKTLYGLLIAGAAYVPAANEEFRVELYIDQDS
jgi:hypothetical protein